MDGNNEKKSKREKVLFYLGATMEIFLLVLLILALINIHNLLNSKTFIHYHF